MYRMNRQMLIEDFVFPYGQLDKDNEWVKLADLVPWDEAEDAYARWNFWRRPESQWLSRGHSGPWMPRAEDLSAVSGGRRNLLCTRKFAEKCVNRCHMEGWNQFFQFREEDANQSGN